MNSDVKTVLWKEWKALIHNHTSRGRALLTLLVPVMTIAIVMPVVMQEDSLTSAFSLMASLVIPIAIVGMIVPDAFAGERERNTLTTLLASRLPDRAILHGKLLISVICGWALSLIVVLINVAVVNILYWNGKLMFFSPKMAFAHLGVGLLMSLFVSGLGILISLKSNSVQSAQQGLFGVLVVPLSLIQLVPMLMMSVIPNGRAYLETFMKALESPLVLAAICAVWMLIDLALLRIVTVRFKRSRLILG